MWNSYLVLNLLSAIFCDITQPRDQQRSTKIFPWAGILRVNDVNFENEALTGIVIIHKRTAIGNADAVSKIELENIRDTTTAIFYNDVNPWKCKVLNYTIHPEYRDKTANTIALVTLNVNRSIPTFLLTPIGWPDESHYEKSRRVYSITFMDNINDFVRVITEMVPYDIGQCERFYKNEGLDYSYIVPVHYDCYTARGVNHTCLYDSGMAIASNYTGQWVLLGISTYGPGCSLPSRHLKILPYLPWIQENIGLSRRNFLNLRTRATKTITNNVNTISKEIAQDFYDDKDAIVMKYLAKDTVTLQRDFAGQQELVYTSTDKECKRGKYTYLVYRESGYYKVGFNSATVLYSVSIQDLRCQNITCIKSFVKCNDKSKTEVEFHKGFDQDDISKFIKKVPVYDKKHGHTIPPYIKYVQDGYKGYRNREVTSIHFKFSFFEIAEIEVLFYGTALPTTTTPTTTTNTKSMTTSQKRRKARQYFKHYRPNIPRYHGGDVIGRETTTTTTSTTTTAPRIPSSRWLRDMDDIPLVSDIVSTGVKQAYQMRNFSRQNSWNTYEGTTFPIDVHNDVEVNNVNDELLKTYNDNYKLLIPRNVNVNNVNNRLLKLQAFKGGSSKTHTLTDEPFSSTRINNKLLKSYNVDNDHHRNSHFNYNYNTFLRTYNLSRNVLKPRKYRNSRNRMQNIKNELQKSETFNGDDESVSHYGNVNNKKMGYSHLNYNYNSFNFNDNSSKPRKLSNSNLKLQNNFILHRLRNETLTPNLKNVTPSRLNYKYTTSRHLNLKNVIPHRLNPIHSKGDHLFNKNVITSRLNYENVTPRRLYYKRLRPLNVKEPSRPHIFRKAYGSSHVSKYLTSQSVENIDTLNKPLRSKDNRVYKRSYESEYK